LLQCWLVFPGALDGSETSICWRVFSIFVAEASLAWIAVVRCLLGAAGVDSRIIVVPIDRHSATRTTQFGQLKGLTSMTSLLPTDLRQLLDHFLLIRTCDLLCNLRRLSSPAPDMYPFSTCLLVSPSNSPAYQFCQISNFSRRHVPSINSIDPHSFHSSSDITSQLLGHARAKAGRDDARRTTYGR